MGQHLRDSPAHANPPPEAFEGGVGGPCESHDMHAKSGEPEQFAKSICDPNPLSVAEVASLVLSPKNRNLKRQESSCAPMLHELAHCPSEELGNANSNCASTCDKDPVHDNQRDFIAEALLLINQLEPGQPANPELERSVVSVLERIEDVCPLTPRTYGWVEAVYDACLGNAGSLEIAQQHPHGALPKRDRSTPPPVHASHPMAEDGPTPSSCITFANTTSWNQTTAQWVASQRSICTMISETHLGPIGQSRAATVLDRLGIRVHSAPVASTDKGGWAGGLLAAAHRHRNIAWKPGFIHEGCGFLVAMVRLKGWTLAVVGLYLRNSEGLQGATNSVIVANLISYLQLLKTPWVVGGDWNIAPAAMADTTIPTLLHAALLLEVSWIGSWRRLLSAVPSPSLIGRFPCEAAATPMPQLWRPRPIPDLPGPRLPWTAYRNQPLTDLFGQPADHHLTQSLAAWSFKLNRTSWHLQLMLSLAADGTPRFKSNLCQLAALIVLCGKVGRLRFGPP